MTNPVQISDAAQQMLNTWDQFINGEPCSDMIKADVDLLIKAACFAAQAYEDMIASPITADAAPGTLLRIFLTAIVDPASKELDPYRAKNRPDATLTNEGAKPVDVAAVRRQAFEDYSDLLERLVSGVISVGMHDDNSTEMFDVDGASETMADADAAIRALSAEPAQGEQWLDMKALSELSKRTYAIQYNPNCPDKYLVRLPNNGAIDLKPYGNAAFHISNQTNDILGFGKTLHEAYAAAIAAPTPEAEA